MNTITLHYRQSTSDKVYQAAIEPQDELFVVNFAYGRRGTTLQTGTKTTTPVDLVTAERIFQRLVNEKKAKGYTEAEDGTPYRHSERQTTEIGPQLLNPIEDAEAARLVDDPAWCAQEKFDGRRLLVRKQDAAIHGLNRKGILVGVPSPWIAQLPTVSGGVQR